MSIESIEIAVLDSYQKFIETFNISFEKLIEFGLSETILVSPEEAREQWNKLISDVFSNNPVYIRQYGRIGLKNKLFLDFITDVFGNTNVTIDSTNNSEPTKVIMNTTGKKKGKDIINYQVSHIFGRTKNPLLFCASWNIAYIPKVLDPFTGHEAKGLLKEQFEKEFKNHAYSKYKDIIKDYNRILDKFEVEKKIELYIDKLYQSNIYSTKDIREFKKELLINFGKL